MNLAITILTLLGLISCAHETKVEKKSIHIMTYNVENLFDTTHDEGKNDHAFLPENGWTEEKLSEKLSRLAQVILQSHGGVGPDVLFLVEIENLQILNRLNSQYLKGIYQESILIEGEDSRGIDVAILSKLPLVKKPILHQIPFTSPDSTQKFKTREILEACLELPDGSQLMAFALHLPSPRHPKELRLQALNFLNTLAKPYRSTHYIIAAGDFNITAKEDLTEKHSEKMSQDWIVSHSSFKDKNKGTYYYHPDQTWSFLDWMLFSKKFEAGKEGWSLSRKSLQILKNNTLQMSQDGTPLEFHFNNSKGVSDHFPLGASLIGPWHEERHKHLYMQVTCK